MKATLLHHARLNSRDVVTPLVSSSCELWLAANRRRLLAVDENATNDRTQRNEVRLVMVVNDGGVPRILAQKHDTEPSASAIATGCLRSRLLP